MIRRGVSRSALVAVILIGTLVIAYGLWSSRFGSDVRPNRTHFEAVSPSSAAAAASPGLSLFGGQEDKPDEVLQFNEAAEKVMTRRRSVVQPRREVEIWGKASIAEYLWSHILNGNATTYANGLLAHGELTLDDIHIRYRSGPGIIQNTVPNTVKYLVLVLNGKDPLKIRFARSWLDYLVHLRQLRRVALVMLGSEQCDNDWLRPYLRSQGGPVDVVFLVYDSPLIDGTQVLQWPLGVATYRGFPRFRSDKMSVKAQRKHLCNFFGTVYPNSSRESLMENIPSGKAGKLCETQTRDTWSPSETFASMDRYLRTLSESDLTLSPVGKNSECYRIYEALSLGSIPVVEDAMTPGGCTAPLRLLKAYNAPLILVKSWRQLPALLHAEAKNSLKKRIARRTAAVNWYEQFKVQMRSMFLTNIRYHFFTKPG